MCLPENQNFWAILPCHIYRIKARYPIDLVFVHSCCNIQSCVHFPPGSHQMWQYDTDTRSVAGTACCNRCHPLQTWRSSTGSYHSINSLMSSASCVNFDSTLASALSQSLRLVFIMFSFYCPLTSISDFLTLCFVCQSLAAGLTCSQPVAKLRALPLWLSLQYLGHNGIVTKIKHAATLVSIT